MVLILQPPAAVAALPPGTVLKAVVVPTPPSVETQSAPGRPVVTLRTPEGEVSVRLPVQIPDNARVALEVLRNAAVQAGPQATPQVTVRLVTVDGQPAAQVLAQLARQAVDTRGVQPPPTSPQNAQIDTANPLQRTAVLLPGAAWTPAGPLQIVSLGTFSAVVTQGLPTPQTGDVLPPGAPPALSAALAPTAPAAQAFIPPTGTELSLRVTDVQLPGTPATPMPVTPNAVALIPSPPGVPLPTSVPVVMPAASAEPSGISLTPVTTIPATAVAQPVLPQPGLVLPGPQGLGTPPPAPPLGVQTPPLLTTLTGTVIGVSSNGAPVVDTTAGQVQLNLRANLPAGTHVTLEITARLEPQPGAALPPPAPVSALPMSGPPGATTGWPTLAESLSLLQRSDPQAAQQLVQTIPDGGPRTAAALISFVQAMRSGDARQWPGDANLRALESVGPRGAHLASQLSDEVAALSSRARDTGTEWRALPVPWNADGHIDRIALVTRREGDSDDGDKKRTGGGATRFLINLDLSHLGSMQLDGMFRKDTRGFDLMIRTKAALPENMRLDLTGIFATSNAAMGLKGGLTFQVMKKFADPVSQAGAMDKAGLWA